MTDKIKIATASLSGCFGCHMSILDIDEKLIDLIQLVEFNRSPLTDIKHAQNCDIGLIEGAVANSENIEVLQEFRAQCKILIGVGACALNGGIPAMRNHYSLTECIKESYVDGMGLDAAKIPDDPDIPMLLDKVVPIQEVVRVDYVLPGCPPSAEIIWNVLTALLAGKKPIITAEQIHYD